MEKPMQDDSTGVFYLDHYIPKRYWQYFNEDKLAFSQNLLIYKNNANNNIWANYTLDLMNALAYIAENRLWCAMEIHMVAVPSSNPVKQSTMKKTINKIAELSDDGTVERLTQCKKPMRNAAGLIVRQNYVQAAHLSTDQRPSFQEHVDSMRLCKQPNRANIGYVIMDDILTTGTQMNACNYLLSQAGVNPMFIEHLVIGRTI